MVTVFGDTETSLLRSTVTELDKEGMSMSQPHQHVPSAVTLYKSRIALRSDAEM